MVDLDVKSQTRESPALAPNRRNARLRSGRVDRRLARRLIIPAVLVELVVHIIPMMIGTVTSTFGLTQYNIRDWTQAPFVGFKNFRLALDPTGPIGRAFLESLVRTIVLTLIVIAISWLLGMGAALLVEDRAFKYRGIARTFFILPYIIPAYVGAIAWRFLLQRDGAINSLLYDDLGVISDKPFWLIGGLSSVSFVVTLVWSTWPFAFLYLMTGLQTIPADRYEAAALDGASAWQRFVHITLPGLKPVNAVLLLLLFLWTVNNFTTSYTLFGDAPPREADVIPVHVFRVSFGTLNFGLGSAMSVSVLLVLMVTTALYWRIMRLGRNEDA